MKVGDLVRFIDWYGGYIGKIIAIDTEGEYNLQIEWIVGDGNEVFSPTFECQSILERL